MTVGVVTRCVRARPRCIPVPGRHRRRARFSGSIFRVSIGLQWVTLSALNVGPSGRLNRSTPTPDYVIAGGGTFDADWGVQRHAESQPSPAAAETLARSNSFTRSERLL